MANTNVAAMSSAMVLEPKGVQTLDVGSAMEQVVAALLKNGPGSGAAYGVLVYGTRDPKPQPNMLVAAKTFFHAYHRAWKVLTNIADFTHAGSAKSALQTIENKEFDHVRFFVGLATEKVLKDRVKPTPGVYIMTAHLDAKLLKTLDLPPLPERFRNLPLVMQIESEAEPMQSSYPIQASINEGNLLDMELLEVGDEVEEPISRDTLEWRQQFIRSNPSWTSAQVAAESTSTARNRAAIASRWLREKKIFAIRYEGQQCFPRFQFQDGIPSPVIAQVIKIFPEHATGWDLAYFFATPNPNIGGRKPIELLKSNPARVVSLAEAFAHPADAF
jgi:hypothetical protein